MDSEEIPLIGKKIILKKIDVTLPLAILITIIILSLFIYIISDTL